MAAKRGDRVKIHFTGKTTEGQVFASSYEENEPLEFEVGQGALLPGVEHAVEGMEKGEKKNVTLSPEEGFGHHHDELIIRVDRSQFPPGFEPEVGQTLQSQQPDGSIAYLTVLEVGDSDVKLDGNHPLAGRSVTFELELLEISA